MRKATFTGPGEPLKIVDDVLPDVPAEGALIRITYSGVCHSDVHLRNSEIDLGDGIIFSPYKIQGERYLGSVFGHEICGTVLAFGDKANQGSLKVGDNVVVFPWIGCGECGMCKIGLSNRCGDIIPNDIGVGPVHSGGYATHIPVPKVKYLIKVPESLPLPIACMLPCSGATAYASLRKSTLHVDRAIKARGQANLLVVGAGGLGLWCIQLAKRGLFADRNVKVFVADISEDKFGPALEAGADEGIVWEKEGTKEDAIMKTTKNGEQKMDVIINFVGNQKTSEIAVNCLNRAGILVLIGLLGGSMKIQIPLFILQDKTMTGGKASTLQELADLVELVSKVGLDYPSLKYSTLDEVNNALDDLEAGKMKGRTVLKF